MTERLIAIADIEQDLALQPRATLHRDWIEEYAMEMAEGAKFPPVVVFFDADERKGWLADGFHRVLAAEAAGCGSIMADVRSGTRRDALLYSVGANAVHGHRRTNDDKRRAVEILLNDPEWELWPDRQIAEQCGVTHPFVAGQRLRLSGNGYQLGAITKPRKVTRAGTTYEMNTGNIGEARRRRVVEEPAEPAELPLPKPAVPSRAVVEPFDHEAATLRERAMSAVGTLAELPPAADVMAAWMKTWGYGVPIEKLERAIAWLEAFLPLYRVMEPERWARVQRAAAADRGLFTDAAD
jgi:hypothetical protein